VTNVNAPITSTVSGRATLCYGPWVETADLAGKSIKELRGTYTNLWTIPDDAVAYKGKEAMTEDYIVQPGDRIELFRRMGEKG